MAEARIEFARVTRVLDMLTLAQRQVIELRFFGGLTLGEVGQVLNRSGGAVR
jgi:DNA-directed RNA polymerase specialized sigma24 family protein